MTKKEAVREFGKLYPRKTFISIFGGRSGRPQLDRVMRDEIWNNYTDALCKDRQITPYQYDTWLSPWRS